MYYISSFGLPFPTPLSYRTVIDSAGPRPTGFSVRRRPPGAGMAVAKSDDSFAARRPVADLPTPNPRAWSRGTGDNVPAVERPAASDSNSAIVFWLLRLPSADDAGT